MKTGSKKRYAKKGVFNINGKRLVYILSILLLLLLILFIKADGNRFTPEESPNGTQTERKADGQNETQTDTGGTRTGMPSDSQAGETAQEAAASPIRLSAESGFYDTDLVLEVRDISGKEGRILYTTDGSQPQADTAQSQADGSQPQADTAQSQADGSQPQADTAQSQADGSQPQADTAQSQEDGSEPQAEKQSGVLVYDEPIKLTAEEKEKTHVLRFCSFYEDGTSSDTVTASYVMGKGIFNRYDTLVLSVSGDPQELYGEERGIFVEGKLRKDWLSEHPGEEPSYDTPANYNLRGKESERSVHIELFEPDGTRIVNKDGGIRISGNFTRQSEQKSFKLYARWEYDDNVNGNKFKYPFFDDLRSRKDGAVIDEYETLKVRNTGNDRSEGFIRDELGLTLAAQVGYEDTQSVRPVSVYINGSYEGCYWIHSTYDDEYFKEKYGSYEGEMVVIGKGETGMATDTQNPLENEYAAAYTELYNRYSAMDLTDDSACKELNERIDLENYLRYYAVEIYMANRDWPYNNLQAYRYVSPDGNYEKDTVFDGRYRYLLFDVDTTMGLGSVRDSLDVNQSIDTLKLIEERGYAPLFSALLKREDCRLFLAGALCDLANGAYSPENVSAVLENLHEKRINEMRAYIKESEEDPLLPDISETYLDMQADCIRAWAEATPESMINGIGQLWQLGEPYTLYLMLPEGTGAGVNSVEVRTAEFTGRYLPGLEVKLSPLLPPGESFAYWEVNGEAYMEETMILDPGMITDGAVYVTLYTESESGGLSLQRISAGGNRSNGRGDYLVLENTSEQEVSTWGYFLMDKDKVSHMNYLENTVLAPGETLLVGCRNYTGGDSFMNVNFNLKKGETVMLGKSAGGVFETVDIPDLVLPDGEYVKDALTGEWREERREERDGA